MIHGLQCHPYVTHHKRHCLSHTGWFLAYNASNLRPNVTDAVEAMLTYHKGAPIYVLGHSMGGAVATLCALDLLFTFQLEPGRVRLYTYGSPRVGNEAFAHLVKLKIPVSTAGSVCMAWASCQLIQ